jgi:hypothetical protein
MFRARIEGGELCFPSMKAGMAWRAWMENHEGARVVIEEEKTTRSTSQNAFYWAYLGVIATETGDNPDYLHEFFKRKLLPPRFVKVRGEELRLPATTTDLDKAAFTDYLDKISALTGIPLPNVEDAGYISNYEPPVH